jgi:hypothetical protein
MQLGGIDPARQRLHCNEGIIYYRTTKQRVRLPITPELENWILQNIAEARRGSPPIPRHWSIAKVRALFACAGLFTRRNADAGRGGIASSIGCGAESARQRTAPEG